MALALSSPNLAPSALYDMASTVLAKNSRRSMASAKSCRGSSLPAVRVQLNPNALAHHGISLDEVRQAIVGTNSVRPRGFIEHGRTALAGPDQRSVAARGGYLPLIIRYRDGAPVRLRDVATVTDSVENRYSSGFHNDRPAVLLMIHRQPGANIIATIDAINAQLPGLRALLPADADLTARHGPFSRYPRHITRGAFYPAALRRPGDARGARFPGQRARRIDPEPGDSRLFDRHVCDHVPVRLLA